VVTPAFNAREPMLHCLQRLDDPAIALTAVLIAAAEARVVGARQRQPCPGGIPQLYFVRPWTGD
jgi:hypothetical protein